MIIGTHIKSTIVKAVVCGIAVAALGAPAALADPPQGHRATSPDALDRYVANNRQREAR